MDNPLTRFASHFGTNLSANDQLGKIEGNQAKVKKTKTKPKIKKESQAVTKKEPAKSSAFAPSQGFKAQRAAQRAAEREALLSGE